MRGRTTHLIGAMTGWCALGCSFIVVSGPPSAPEERTEKAANECTTNVAPPVVDANLAFWTGVLLMVAAAKADSFEHETNVEWWGLGMTPGTTLAVGAANLAVFGGSATYGFIQTSRCGRLQQEVRARKPLWSPALSTAPPAPKAAAAGPSDSAPTVVPPAPPSSPAPAASGSAATAPATPASSAAPAPPPSASPPTVSFPDP